MAQYVLQMKAVLEKVDQQLATVMIALEKTSHNWGLIHADLNENNYIFHQGETRPIDFSCCGFGYYLSDIANSLLHLVPENRRSFLSGYQHARKQSLPNNYQNILEAFSIAATINNFAFHASQPKERDYLQQAVPYVIQKFCTKYFEGESFLFDC
ncbi:MAG: phosphotransferase [Heteroscytonema crispum UTEX LB 1556]